MQRRPAPTPPDATHRARRPRLRAQPQRRRPRLGPDGYLYWSIGDGGGEGDPSPTARTRRSCSANILRIDPSAPRHGGPYAIPTDNPFADGVAGRARGLDVRPAQPVAVLVRSPDPGLWIGDVGQDPYEEVDFLPPERPAGRTSAGATSRGRTRTGRRNRRPAPSRRSTSTTTRAVRCSITGGYVYRGNDDPRAARDVPVRRLLRRQDQRTRPRARRLGHGHRPAPRRGRARRRSARTRTARSYVLSQQSGVERIDLADPAPADATAPTTTSAPPTTQAGPAPARHRRHCRPRCQPIRSTAADELVAAERAIRRSGVVAADARRGRAHPATRVSTARPTSRARRHDPRQGRTRRPRRDRDRTSRRADELAAIPGAPLQDKLPRAWRVVARPASDELLSVLPRGRGAVRCRLELPRRHQPHRVGDGRIQGFSCSG